MPKFENQEFGKMAYSSMSSVKRQNTDHLRLISKYLKNNQHYQNTVIEPSTVCTSA